MAKNPQNQFTQGINVTSFGNYGLSNSFIPTINSEKIDKIIFNGADTSQQSFFDDSIATTGNTDGLKRETVPDFTVNVYVYGQDLEVEMEQSFIDTDGYALGLFPDGNADKFTSRVQTKEEILNSTVDIFKRRNAIQFYQVGTLYESAEWVGGEASLANSRFPGGVPIVNYYELLASPTRPHVDLLGTGDSSLVIQEGSSSINDNQQNISAPAFIDETKKDIDYVSISDATIVSTFGDFVSGTTDSAIKPHTKFANQGFEYLNAPLGTDSLAFGGLLR